jgi:hypothetical protein
MLLRRALQKLALQYDSTVQPIASWVLVLVDLESRRV